MEYLPSVVVQGNNHELPQKGVRCKQDFHSVGTDRVGQSLATNNFVHEGTRVPKHEKVVDDVLGAYTCTPDTEWHVPSTRGVRSECDAVRKRSSVRSVVRKNLRSRIFIDRKKRGVVLQ